MGAFLDSFQLYFKFVSISIRAQLQYRVSTFFMMGGNFLFSLIDFFAIWALFHRFGSIRGWSLPEVALMYGMINLSFSIAEAFARGFDSLSTLLKSGSFDRLLLRPRSTAFLVAVQEWRLDRLGRALQGTIVLTTALALAKIDWTFPKTLLLIASILSGACLFAGTFVLQATLCFWTIDNLEIVNVFTHGGVETAQYPLSVYRPGFRRFFTYVIPIACVNYLPLHAILERPETMLGAPVALQWLSPVLGVVFLLLSFQVWRLGVRRYSSTGA